MYIINYVDIRRRYIDVVIQSFTFQNHVMKADFSPGTTFTSIALPKNNTNTTNNTNNNNNQTKEKGFLNCASSSIKYNIDHLPQSSNCDRQKPNCVNNSN